MLHTHYWTELAWTDFEALDNSRLIAVLPLAAVEQHGPHLPLGVDHFIMEGYLERVIERLPGDFFLNVQGDEPFIQPALLDGLITRWKETRCPLVTAVSRITTAERLLASSVVKVVRAENGEAIYFSRSPIPHLRGVDPAEWVSRRAYWVHIGVYGYDRATLAGYAQLRATELEATESLEQLRFLAHGKTFQTVVTDYHPVAIDTPEDLAVARGMV